MNARVGLIGARGHTGKELLTLIAAHPSLDLAYASSRDLAGRKIHDEVTTWAGDDAFVALGADAAAIADVDVAVLAMPNGASAAYIDTLTRVNPNAAIVDLSADRRFDDGDGPNDFVYGLVERHRARLRSAKRISNPGCYATGAQLALWPFLDVIDGAAHVFGVSGYSGAGTTPSRKNDTHVLENNLLAYALTGHMHEREVSHHLAHPVHFVPHVASFFRGIHLTVSFSLREPSSSSDLKARAAAIYENEALVSVQDEIPEVKDIAHRHDVKIGGFAVSDDGGRAVVCATIDNLLKGAATQAMQNINLALGFPELAGIAV